MITTNLPPLTRPMGSVPALRENLLSQSTVKLNKDEALKLYRQLSLVRLSEEKIRQEYFTDAMKTPVHLGIGGEAISVGVCHKLPLGTKSFATYRNHALYLTVSNDTDAFFGELYGKANGASKGKAGSMHLMSPEKGFMASSAVVGTTVPLAVGAAFANKYRENAEIAVVFFGDGAVEEGAFWESINFASLHRLKVLFVCEDNDLAIHTSKKDRRGYKSLTRIVDTLEFHTAEGDGTDLLSVIEAADKVVSAMNKETKPGFLYFPYFRFYEHVGPKEDFSAGYRKAPTQEEIDQYDPVLKFEWYLLKQGFSSTELSGIRDHVERQIESSVKAAVAAPYPGPEELYKDVLI